MEIVNLGLPNEVAQDLLEFLQQADKDDRFFSVIDILEQQLKKDKEKYVLTVEIESDPISPELMNLLLADMKVQVESLYDGTYEEEEYNYPRVEASVISATWQVLNPK